MLQKTNRKQVGARGVSASGSLDKTVEWVFGVLLEGPFWGASPQKKDVKTVGSGSLDKTVEWVFGVLLEGPFWGASPQKKDVETVGSGSPDKTVK